MQKNVRSLAFYHSSIFTWSLPNYYYQICHFGMSYSKGYESIKNGLHTRGTVCWNIHEESHLMIFYEVIEKVYRTSKLCTFYLSSGDPAGAKSTAVTGLPLSRWAQAGRHSFSSYWPQTTTCWADINYLAIITTNYNLSTVDNRNKNKVRIRIGFTISTTIMKK